jgi:hypothetical protein
MQDYKSEIKDVYKRLKSMQGWKLIEEEDGIQYFRNDTHVKTEAIVKFDLNKLITMASDISANTRMKWDPFTNGTLTSLEEYKTDDGVIHVVGFNGTVGIQWKRNNMIIYKTTKHKIHNATVNVENEYMIWAKELDEGKCFFTCIGLKPYVKLKYMLNAKYGEIYSQWVCKICAKKLPPHELECRHCKTERFSRCKDKQCYEAQREGNVLCQFCNKKL